MVHRFLESLHTVTPPVRLERYRRNAPTDRLVLTNYFWNISLCEALYPSLHAAELALRNSVNGTLRDHFHEEWWTEPGLLHSKQRKKVDDQRTALKKHSDDIVSPDRVVASLNFGFWVYLLEPKHNESWIWQPDDYQLLNLAFPYRAGNDLRAIHTRSHAISALRNRVMHHEAIFDWDTLVNDHIGILDAVGWISPELRACTEIIDNFPRIHQNGWNDTYQKLGSLLGFA